MANLRKAARGRECQVRIPGVCNGNPETSVLAHIRIAGLCGTSIKPPDLIATIALTAELIWLMRNMRRSARWRGWSELRLSG